MEFINEIKIEFRKNIEKAMVEFYDSKLFEYHTIETDKFLDSEKKEFSGVVEKIIIEFFKYKGNKFIYDISEEVISNFIKENSSNHSNFMIKKGLEYITEASLIAIDFTLWKKHDYKFCSKLEGTDKTKCQIKGCNVNISLLKEQLNKCESNDEVKSLIKREISNWNNRKSKLEELL